MLVLTKYHFLTQEHHPRILLRAPVTAKSVLVLRINLCDVMQIMNFA